LKRDRKPIVNNPVVHRALFELRKVVNAIIREYGKPKRVVVEIIRELKLPLSRRIEAEDRKNLNEKERESARSALRNDFGVANANGTDILAYRLWNQQNRVSPYSGRGISQTHMRDFLHGRGVLQIDHILPYSMTLDDSQNNKCLCFVEENLRKGQRTPRVWKVEGSPEYDEMLTRVAHMKDSGMPWPKRRRFSQKEVKSDGFVARQLEDTAYLAREVRGYLKCLYSGTEDSRMQRVQSRPGHVTAALRYQWHLNTILSPDGSNEKNRADHRHHAIDAIVIALTTPSHLHHLSQTDRSLRERRAAMPPPDNWATFVGDVRSAVQAINISNRVQRRIAGKLHDDNPLRKTEKHGSFVIRKELSTLKLSMVNKTALSEKTAITGIP
jgi:CRISPR-associated endonuclease Csn1